jgi:glycosyltransferase involved in cell wall biosynthesis
MLTTDLAMGGAERTIINLAECLRERGVRCAVAGLFEGGRGEARCRLEEEGFQTFCAGLETPRHAWRLWQLRRFVKGWRPDVLHAHLFHGHAAAALLRLTGLSAPAVWTHHAAPPEAWPLRQAFYRFFSRAAAVQVYVSEAVRDYHHRTAGVGARESVIHNGIDLEPFLAIEPRPGPVFGAVGRLVPLCKGFDVLIRAFARLCRERADISLRIAGDGPDRGALEELARREGVADRVEFAGFVRDVPAFLAEVNVFVNPSRWEAFGITLVEGMAAGLPCIASHVYGLPEVGNGFVRWVTPGDVNDLHSAMREAAAAEEHPARAAAQRRHVAGRFGRERMAQDYLELYRSLTGRQGTCS